MSEKQEAQLDELASRLGQQLEDLRAELTRLRDENERLKKESDEWQRLMATSTAGKAVVEATLRARSAEAKLACVAQVEQEMREQWTKSGNAGHRIIARWADALASLRNDQRAEHTCHDMNPPFPGPCLACGREKGQ